MSVAVSRSSTHAAKRELNSFIDLKFKATCNVAFTRNQAVAFEENRSQRAVLSVWWGKEAQGVPQSGLQPTAQSRDCFVDIRAKDGYTAEDIYEELKAQLRSFQPRYIRIVGINPDPLINDRLETDGVRATIMCRYVS